MLNHFKLLVFLILNIFCLIFIFLGCSDNKKINSEIEKIPLEIKFDRFDLKFASIEKKEFQNFKKKIQLFISKSIFRQCLVKKKK